MNVIPKSKSKPKPSPSPSPSETTVAAAESSHGTTSVPGDASDGFETASESDFNDGGGGAADDDHDNNNDNDGEHQQQHQRPSVPPKDGSLEAASNDESTQKKALAAANDAKLGGNRLFGNGQYEEALSQYDLALQVVPDMPAYVEIRSICHANRALCFLKLGKYEDTIKDCTKALELNPNCLKLRRGEAHEKLEHFEEAIADLKKVLELDQSDVQARRTIQRLEPLAAEKHERMKQEMIGQLTLEQVADLYPSYLRVLGSDLEVYHRQVLEVNLVEGDGEFSKVVKTMQAKASLVQIGSIPPSELGKLKACLLNTRSDGIWDVLVEVVAALQHVEGSI